MISDATTRLIRSGEGANVEFVSSIEPHEKIAKTICAFLNTNGGVVVCGVSDDGRRLGVEGAETRVRALETQLQNAISPKSIFQIVIERDEDVALVLIEVPIGLERPYMVDGRVLVRHGAQTRAATTDGLRAMIQERSAEPLRWERRPAIETGWDDLDLDEINATVTQAHESGRFTFRHPNDPEAVLRDLGMFGRSGLTNAGDLLFGVHSAVRHPQTRVRFMAFATDKAGPDYEDDRWFHGPAVQVLEQTLQMVTRNLRQPSRFREGDPRRENRREYPFWALREGIVNAIAHRDYASFSGGLSVSLFPDRVEIWNSGRLPAGLKPGDLKKFHQSIPVNPDIAHVLYMRDLMDRTGRGTTRIVAACRAHGLPAPKWEDRPTGVTLTLFGAARTSGTVWNARQQSLLETLRPGERVTPAVYHARYASDVTERQARRDLGELDDAGLLVREGGGAATTYRRTDVPSW